jgi:hypothetical protein
MLGFSDDKYPGETPNKIFPFIVIAMLVKHDVLRILIDQGNSSDIMYQELFEKLGLKRKGLTLYEGTYLHRFNGLTTKPWVLSTYL